MLLAQCAVRQPGYPAAGRAYQPPGYQRSQLAGGLPCWILRAPSSLSSHDRHFLNNVCTHIVDIDYGKIKMYVGNYEFWYESSQLVQQHDQGSEPARTRKRSRSCRTSSQRFCGKQVQVPSGDQPPQADRQADRRGDAGFVPPLPVGSVSTRTVRRARTFSRCAASPRPSTARRCSTTYLSSCAAATRLRSCSDNELAMTTLFQILMGEMKPDEGSFKWGVTTSQSYFPKDNNEFFEGHEDNHARLDRASIPARITLESTSARLPRPYAVLRRRCLQAGSAYCPAVRRFACMLARMMLFGSNVLCHRPADQPP